MFNFFRRKKDTAQAREKKSDFSIEFYPLTGVYYPKHGSWYLLRNHQTGIIERKEHYLFHFCNSFPTEEGAKEFLTLYREQQLKENVVTTYVD